MHNLPDKKDVHTVTEHDFVIKTTQPPGKAIYKALLALGLHHLTIRADLIAGTATEAQIEQIKKLPFVRQMHILDTKVFDTTSVYKERILL